MLHIDRLRPYSCKRCFCSSWSLIYHWNMMLFLICDLNCKQILIWWSLRITFVMILFHRIIYLFVNIPWRESLKCKLKFALLHALDISVAIPDWIVVKVDNSRTPSVLHCSIINTRRGFVCSDTCIGRSLSLAHGTTTLFGTLVDRLNKLQIQYVCLWLLFLDLWCCCDIVYILLLSQSRLIKNLQKTQGWICFEVHWRIIIDVQFFMRSTLIYAPSLRHIVLPWWGMSIYRTFSLPIHLELLG